jgi:thiamine-monophosphate kinase
MTISDFTEAELIARIQHNLPFPPDWLLVGIGDDAAVVQPERNRAEVFSVDALVDGVHFDRAFVPPDAIGHRALAVNLSDLAAMGAQPRLALLSMALPPRLPIADFDQIVLGFSRLALEHRVHLAGGNLTRTPGPLLIDVTVVGSVKRRQALTRKGARPGDELYVSGTIGGAAAGRQALQTGRPVDGLPMASCARQYLYPEPRVRAGVMLARNRAVRACVDLSDGLADAVHQIARASSTGAVVEAGLLPLPPPARDWFHAQGLDPAVAAVSGGDDYELLVAVAPRHGRRFNAVAARAGVSFTRIGACTDGHDVVIRSSAHGGAFDAPLTHTGYVHFR